MAHKLGLKVIGEGVETVEQRDWLHAAGCDYAQGYLFSEAIPPEEFEQILKTMTSKQEEPGTHILFRWLRQWRAGHQVKN
jgi:sensor c-di-GMP phosphodiesterase-like protein